MLRACACAGVLACGAAAGVRGLRAQVRAAPVPPDPTAAEVSAACASVPAGAGALLPMDADGDGLADACELRLAQRFAPLLVVRAGGCNWDASVAPARPGGGYLFAVRPLEGGGARIAYLPAYHRDCGWHGPKCWFGLVNCAGHAGDSELVMVDVRPDSSGLWRTEGVFLSAHCFGEHAERCRWYRGPELAAFRWEGGPRMAPVVWVAEGRQANYPDRRSCEAGIHHIDTCARNAMQVRYPVLSSRQNIGSPARPAYVRGCLPGRALWASAREDPARLECFWDGRAAFRGWQRDTAGVTPYAVYLRSLGGFQ